MKLRRYKCLSCGKVFPESQNLVPLHSKVSYETILNVLNGLRSYSSTWKDVAEHCHISDTACKDVFDRYVNPKRMTLPNVLCIDECYNDHQFSKPYSCVLFDFLQCKMVDCFEDRSKLNLISYFSKIDPKERQNVNYVIIDMWEAYLDVSQTMFPNAIVAIDSFHVIKEIGDALSKVRKRIMHKYESKTTEYKLLKHHNYVLFKSYLPSEEKRKIKYLENKYYNNYGLKEKIFLLSKELEIASNFYTSYRFKNEHLNKEQFTVAIDDFINYKDILTIPEFVPIISMLQNWKEWILNSFTTVNGRRLSNGPIEGFNSNYKKNCLLLLMV